MYFQRNYNVTRRLRGLSITGAVVTAALGIFVASSAGSAPATATLTPDQYIAARQASYDMSAITFAEMKTALSDGADIKKQFYAAKALGRWARVLPTLFPAGTGQGETATPTHALPKIWSDRAGFEKAAADYAAAADKLQDLARSGDTAGFSDQLSKLDKTCDACHDDYKAK